MHGAHGPARYAVGMSVDVPSEDLLHELKIQRYAENSTRLHLGALAGFPVIVAIDETVRYVVHGEVGLAAILMGSLMVIFALVLAPNMRRFDDQWIGRQLACGDPAWVRKWRDNPMSQPRCWAIFVVGFPLWIVGHAALSDDWGISGLFIISFFATGLLWAGLRWRIGDELVCARCEYPKTPDSGDICPECGSAWIIADTLALGRIRLIPWMVAVGAGAIALDLFFVVSDL